MPRIRSWGVFLRFQNKNQYYEICCLHFNPVKTTSNCFQRIECKSRYAGFRGFLLDLKGNKLSIASSNLEMTINTEVEVNGSENGKIAVPGKTLLETLKSLPEQPLNFVINTETRGIEITSASGKYKLVGEGRRFSGNRKTKR